MLLFFILLYIKYAIIFDSGEVAERSNAAVLKTVEGYVLRGFESLPLRHNVSFYKKGLIGKNMLPACFSGFERTD